MNAHAINEGKFPDISNGKNTDFFYIEKEDPEEAVQEIVRLKKKYNASIYVDEAHGLGVFAPSRLGYPAVPLA